MPCALSVGPFRSYGGDVTITARPAPAPWLLFALWALTGLALVVTVLGILSIGIFVAPFAIALLVWAIVLTTRRPDNWPAVAGLGLALAVGFVWFGVFMGTGSPSSGSCSSSPSGVETCTSGGQPYDPGAFRTREAAPWLAAGGSIALLTFVTYRAARKLVTATGQRPEPAPGH